MERSSTPGQINATASSGVAPGAGEPQAGKAPHAAVTGVMGGTSEVAGRLQTPPEGGPALSVPRINPRHLRPLLWRLPLIVLLIFGVVTLVYVDRVLQRDYRKEATTQAVQTDALLESFVTHRLFTLGTLRALLSGTAVVSEQLQRFLTFSEEIIEHAPDLESIVLLDPGGAEVDAYRRGGARGRGVDHRRIVERIVALERARFERRTSLSGTLRLDDGRNGMIAYLPIERADRITGFIAAGIPYQALFDDALAGQLQGVFPYRIVDAEGRTIALSADFPRFPARLVTRAVTVPGELSWTLHVAIEPFQPRVARLVNLIVGPLLLLLVVFLVLREEARARRFGEHTLNLEIMSSNLLAANVRLEERAHQIAEANAAKSRFLANVSHELRTPINAIVGYNSLALEDVYGTMPAGLRTAHERIRAASEHLLRLVDDILDLSKIEVGRLALDLGPVNLAALLDGTVTVMQPLADSRRLDLTTSIEPGLPTIVSDASRLRQILLNLTSNAIKFTERGSVTLSARRDPHDPDSRLLVEVRDTGIGIARRDLHRIFEEFEQVRPSGRGDSMQRGTGLGLAISRKLARMLGGDLRVYSRVKRGSIFTLELPVSAPDLPAAPWSTPPGEQRVIPPTPADVAAYLDAEPAAAPPEDRARLDHPSVRG